MNLFELTKRYVDAFGSKDIDRISQLLHEDFKISDPDVSELGPKEKAMVFIGDIFEANLDLRFSAKNIFVDGEFTIIHFNLRIGGKDYAGVDIIRWSDYKMISLDAYLHPTVTV